MAMLAQRTGKTGCASTATINNDKTPSQWQVTDKWYGIYLTEETPIGFLNIVAVPGQKGNREGMQLRLSARMDLMLLGTQTDLTILGSVWLDKQRGLTEVDVRIRSEDSEWQVEASTKEDNSLQLAIHTGGQVLPFTLPASSVTVSTGNNVGLGFDLPDLKPGQETFLEAFDPLSMSPTRARIACIGEDTVIVEGSPLLTRVFNVEMNSMTTRAWAVFRDPEHGGNEIVKIELPIGIVLKKIKPEEAFSKDGSKPSESLLHLAAVRPTGQQPIRGARRMLLRVTGLSEDIALPQDDTQRMIGDNLLEIIVPPEPSAWDLVANIQAGSLAEYLESDALVQSGHPTIRKTAQQIVEDEQGAWPVALRIYQWLWENVEKKAAPGIPSALEVLETRAGDCNEHTVLFAALARSVGLPTRIGLGVVWSDEHQGFYYHAWPEVCIPLQNGTTRWYWMDPTLGQPIADATHVKLVTGGVRNWFQLLPFMGKLQIEVLEQETPVLAPKPAATEENGL